MSKTGTGKDKDKSVSLTVRGLLNQVLELPRAVPSTVIGKSFTTIPLELRHQIYSNLLLDRNAAYITSDIYDYDCERPIIKFKYQIAVLTVSKQISAETLDYFYSQNMFVVIESNLYLPFLQSVCSRAIPMITNRDFCNIKHYALKIQVQHTWDADDSHWPGFAIMAGCHLESWTRLLNGFNIEHVKPSIALGYRRARPPAEPIRKVCLWGNTGSSYYNGDPGAEIRIQRAIQGIRATSRIVPNTSPLAESLNVVFWDVESQKYHNSPSYSMLPPLATLEDCLNLAQTAKENGDKLLRAKDFFKALTEYSIAAQILGVHLWDSIRMTHYRDDLTREHVAFVVRIFTSAARLFAMFEKSKSCSYLVDVALEWATRGNAACTEFEKIELYIWKARLRMGHGEFVAARNILQEALQHWPTHDGIKIELDNIKVKRLQAWKDDVKKQFTQRMASAVDGPTQR